MLSANFQVRLKYLEKRHDAVILNTKGFDYSERADELALLYYKKARVLLRRCNFDDTIDDVSDNLNTVIEYADKSMEFAVGGKWEELLSRRASELRARALLASGEELDSDLNLLSQKKSGRLQEAFLQAQIDRGESIESVELQVDRLNIKSSIAYNLFVKLARYFEDGEKYDDALRWSSKACGLYPGRFEAYLVRGRVYLETENVSEALKDFDKALEISPDHVQARYDRGVFHAHNGNYVQAIEDLTVAIVLAPWFSSAYIHRGISKFILEEYSAAEKDLRGALELSFQDDLEFGLEDAEAFTHLAAVLQECKGEDAVVRLVDTFRDLVRDWGAFMDNVNSVIKEWEYFCLQGTLADIVQ